MTEQEKEDLAWELGQEYGRTHRLEDVGSTEEMWEAAMSGRCPMSFFDVFKYGAQDVWKRRGEIIHPPSFGRGPQENPKAGVTYLAIMPRCRRPKAVLKRDIGWYQKEARLFYEAPGMTAAEARQGISDGTLQPTWINGQPVIGYSAAGAPRTEARVSLDDMLRLAEKHGIDSVLRIGTEIYTSQWAYRGPRRFSWHQSDISGFTYDPNPLTPWQLQKHLKNHDTFEVAYLQEDYKGIPMGGIVAMAKAGFTLSRINDPEMRTKLGDLSGRRYRTTKVIEGGMLREADLEWS